MKQKHKSKTKHKRLHIRRRWLILLIVIIGVSALGARILVSRSSADCVTVWNPYLEEPEQQCHTDSPPDTGGGGGGGGDQTGDVTNESYVPTANPPLQQGCDVGLDIAFLIDTSGSVEGAPLQKERAAMRGFITALKGRPMMFLTSRIDSGGYGTFTADTATALADVDSGSTGQSRSMIISADGILRRDTRRNKQNLAIILTDGRLEAIGGLLGSDGIENLKKAGTHILVIGVGHIDLDSLKRIGGPNVNTGSIYTSDVITTDYDNIGGQLANVAGQICKGGGGGPGGGGGTGNGDGGNGGNGSGSGTGSGGSGSQGGSSATKQTNTPSPIAQSSYQGADQQNPAATPSPFYDGKLFAAGSDADHLSIAASIKKQATSPKIIILSCFIIATLVGAAAFLRQKYSKKMKKNKKK